MDNRLQELTDKIYQEGISKGNEEAEKIVSDARAEAAKIVAEAEKEAEQLVSEATRKSAELKENTQSELKMAARQSVDALKQELISVVNGSVTEDSIKATMADVKFIQQCIETAVKNWATRHDEEIDMKILVPEANEKAIVTYFSGAAKNVLNKGFKIESVSGLKTGFQLAPADGGYKISFTEGDFVNFFKEFLRPKVVELLFEGK